MPIVWKEYEGDFGSEWISLDESDVFTIRFNPHLHGMQVFVAFPVRFRNAEDAKCYAETLKAKLNHSFWEATQCDRIRQN